MSLRLRAAPAALLLCLAGCPDPWAPGESGTYWLVEASESLLSGQLMFQVRDADRLKLEESGQLALTSDQLNLALKRIRADGRVLESERFLLQAGRSASVGTPKVFELTIDSKVRPGGAVEIGYGFTWTGGTSIGRRDLLGGAEGMLYWRRKGGGRCDMVLVAVNGVRP